MLKPWLVGCLQSETIAEQDYEPWGPPAPVAPRPPCATTAPSERSTFWTQSVWLPRYARRGRRASRVRRDRCPVMVASGSVGRPLAASTFSLGSASLIDSAPTPYGVATQAAGGAARNLRQPVNLVIEPCVSLADIEVLVDDVGRVPGFVVLRRRFGRGSYRYSGYIDNVGSLMRWLLDHPSVGAATVSEGTIRVTPGGATA